MRMTTSWWAGLLALLPVAAGGWGGARLFAEEKPTADGPLAPFVYPGAKAYPNVKGAGPAQIADLTTEDAPDKVIKWYTDRVPRLAEMGLLHGAGSDGAGEPYRETVAAVHDSRRTDAKAKAARPVAVWVATARVSTGNVEEYTLTVVVTRGKDEARTHIALSRLAGPQKDKK